MYDLVMLHKVTVSCTFCTSEYIETGMVIQVSFLSLRGDIPMILVSDPTAQVRELLKGRSQYVVGRSQYSSMINNLSAANNWFVRILFAYNRNGGGSPAMAWPYPLQLGETAPSIPQNISLSIKDSTTVSIAWDSPEHSGGAEIKKFIMEIDTSPTFETKNCIALYSQILN